MRSELLRPQRMELEELTEFYFRLRRDNDVPIVPEYFSALPTNTFSNAWTQVFNEPENYKARVLFVDGQSAGFVKVGKWYWSDKLHDEFQQAMRNVTIPEYTGELHQIYLSPEYREKGFGRFLYQSACEDLRSLGY